MIPNPLKAVHLAVKESFDAGLCIVPPREDGSKAPETYWKEFQVERASIEILRDAYRNGRSGIGIVCGKVSGELECLDFDTKEIYGRFKEACGLAGLDDLLESMEAGYSEETPHGFHLLYRPQRCGGCRKLARTETFDTLIEVKAEGGYIIISPTFGAVNSSGPYVRLSGSAATIPAITLEERDALYRVAATFDRTPKIDEVPFRADIDGDEDLTKPGHDFNRRGDWHYDVLLPAGWTLVSTMADREGRPQEYWRRPGKDQGNSAVLHPTLGNGGLFVCFSTSTPIPETETGYSKWRTYAWLHHGGDFEVAARELRRLDYGQRPEPKKEPSKPADEPQRAAVSSWTPASIVIAELENEVQPPMFLARTDGPTMLYEKELNYVFGGPGSLKTWIALAAARERLLAGHYVAFFDFDRNRKVKLVQRLTGIGVPEDVIERSLHYACPVEPSGVKRGAIAARELVASMPLYGLVILDSVNNGARLDNLTMSNEDMAIWFRLSEAFVDAGATVILVDHVTKNHEGRRTPIGAQHKLAAVGGTALRVELVQNPIILPGAERDGFSRIFVEKDRHGFLPTGYGECISVLKLGIKPGDPRRSLIVGLPADGPLEVEKKKTCANCGKVWVPGHPKARFCSDICRNRNSRSKGSVSEEVNGE